MLNKVELEQINKVLDTMLQYELCISDLYKKCAEIFKEDEFWSNLAADEVTHAKNISRIKELLREKAERFEAGRPFNIIALNTVMAEAKDITRQVSQGAVRREKMVVLARDYEQSILESRYAEVVKTSDLEYQTLMKHILAQTYEHRKIIQQTMDGMGGKI